jgi:SAM-dependent methyltransferase
VRERRLVFGEVADLYDRYRPAYPDRLIADLIARAGLDGGRAVLEVGAGTGKATLMFAARGIPVVAVEPSAEMAEVARRNCRGYPEISIEESDFEAWDPQGRRFPLLFSAQAWHWVAPAAGYVKAREVLPRWGTLAAFWNRVAWDGSNLREVVLDAYQRAVPDLPPDGPMHPANLCTDGADDWAGEIAAIEGFADAAVRQYEWDQEYSADDYVGLLATTSEVRLLEEARQTALCDAVRTALRDYGEPVLVPMRTRLCLATRT